MVMLEQLVNSEYKGVAVTKLVSETSRSCSYLSLPGVIFTSFCRLKSARITDSRIKVMNEVITGIRVIKMYAWEYAFKRVIGKLRRLVLYEYTCTSINVIVHI